MEHKPNPNLAPVGKGTFYAAKIQMGDLGTFGGIGVNEHSEVTTEEGTAVPGLIAVGAAAVSVFGGGYPGYGSHIGPALVFGYRASRDIAKLAADRGITRVAGVSSADGGGLTIDSRRRRDRGAPWRIPPGVNR